MNGKAERLLARATNTRASDLAALIADRRVSCVALKALGGVEPLAVVTQLRKQARGQFLTHARE
jgi:hypothetical protein